MDVREKLDLLGAAARFDDCRTSAPDVIAERPRLLRIGTHHGGRSAGAALRLTPPYPRRPTQIYPQSAPNQRVSKQLQLLCVPGRPRHPLRARDARRTGAQLRPDVSRWPGRESFSQFRRGRHASDDGRDAGYRRAGAAEVRFPRLHPPQAVARRRGRAHRAGRRTGGIACRSTWRRRHSRRWPRLRR